jgi:pimeloyl-ACP methyl ester carboxylesterase
MPRDRSASLVLIHGAGSGPWIFDYWLGRFPGVAVEAVDLHANLAVDRATMADYAATVIRAAQKLPSPVALCGWSMGGLAALLASQDLRPQCLILIEPSPPAEIQGMYPDAPLASGTFDPEKVYGRFPPDQRSRPESSRARAERKRGISVPRLACPSLVIYGREFPDDRGRAIARLYGSEQLHFPDLDHWGLILDPRVPQAIARYLT